MEEAIKVALDGDPILELLGTFAMYDSDVDAIRVREKSTCLILT